MVSVEGWVARQGHEVHALSPPVDEPAFGMTAPSAGYAATSDQPGGGVDETESRQAAREVQPRSIRRPARHPPDVARQSRALFGLLASVVEVTPAPLSLSTWSQR